MLPYYLSRRRACSPPTPLNRRGDALLLHGVGEEMLLLLHGVGEEIPSYSMD